MNKITKIIIFLLAATLLFSLAATFVYAEGASGSDNTALDSSSNEGGEGAVEEEKGTDISIDFNPDRMIFSLQFMWKGMLCIFIVIGVLILSVYGMNKLTVLPFFNKNKED